MIKESPERCTRMFVLMPKGVRDLTEAWAYTTAWTELGCWDRICSAHGRESLVRLRETMEPVPITVRLQGGPQTELTTRTERQVYIRHISRLKEENVLLRAELAEQIARRNRAWLWYRSKVRNFIPLMLDALAWHVRTWRKK